jgi:hypothetical protein
MTTIGNDTLKRCRIDGDEVAEITVDGDTVFLLDADLVLDLFNTGAISADTLGLHHNTVFEILEISVRGNTEFNAQTTSQTTSGSDFSITVNSNYEPTNEAIRITANEDVSDPSVTIDGSTVSHSGPLGNGETETGSIDITGTGTYTASVSTNGEVTVDVDWTERNVVKDVDFTFNGVTESVTGPILNNEQSTLGFGVADIIDGDNSVDVTAGGNSNPDLQLTFLLNTEEAMALTDFEPSWDYDEKGDNVLLEYWFDVSNVNAPAEAVEGDPFSVDATIENIGITPVEQDVVMTHTGETLTKTTNLNDKESINVTFDTVINTPGEQTIVVESPQESASDLIQILSKYQLDITIDGASNINTEINSDYSTNVYPSFSPSVYLNGTLAGTATNNSGEDIDVSASIDTTEIKLCGGNFESALNGDYAEIDFRNCSSTGYEPMLAAGLTSDITVTRFSPNLSFYEENSATLFYNDSNGNNQNKSFTTNLERTYERGVDFPSGAYLKKMTFGVVDDPNDSDNTGMGCQVWIESPVGDSNITPDSVS